MRHEHQPKPSDEPDIWSHERAAAALRADHHPIRDIAFGDGTRVIPTADPAIEIDLFPAAGVTRLATRDLQLQLHRQDAPIIGEDSITFAHESQGVATQLAIGVDGDIALRIVSRSTPSEAPERPNMAETAPTGTDPHVTGETARRKPLRAVSDDIEESSPGIENDDDPEDLPRGTERSAEPEQTRLTITGRLGRDPHFRTTRNGTVVATFPVALPETDGSTSWIRTVVFNERAEKLRDQLKSGDRVEVIGYLHERQRRRRDGTPYTSEELYAAVVKIR